MLVLFYWSFKRSADHFQKLRVEEKKPETIAAILELVNVADLMVQTLPNNNLVELGKILQSGWESKKRTAS